VVPVARVPALHPRCQERYESGRSPRSTGPLPTSSRSANPGCALHLAAAGVAIRHPMEIVDEALDGR
jgi:hypothetical protein